MSNIEISALPAASAADGTEVTAVDQGAGPDTVRMTTQAIANLGRAYTDAQLTALKNGVPVGGDTLNELHLRLEVVEALGSLATDAELIAAVAAILGTADAAGDTLGELQALMGLRLLTANNLSDVPNKTTASTNLLLPILTTDGDVLIRLAGALTRFATTTKGREVMAAVDAAAVRTAAALGSVATLDQGVASGEVAVLGAGGRYPIARIASGTYTGTEFVRGDGTLVAPSGGGEVSQADLDEHTIDEASARVNAINVAVAGLVNSAPAGGDTLGELHARLAVVEALGSLATDAELISAVAAILGSADPDGDTLGELQSLIGLRMLKSANLSDVANAVTALANLGGAPIANPTFTGNVVVPDADAATEAMNRQTSDARFVALAGSTSTGEQVAPSFKASGKTGATATPVTLAGGTASGAPASGAHIKGELVVADDGTLWYCTVSGTPGTWVSNGGAPVAADNEGSEVLATVSRIDFIGDGVTVADGGAGTAEVSITGTIIQGRANNGTVFLPILPGIAPTTLTTAGKTANRIYYEPMIVETPFTLGELWTEVTTLGVAGVARHAIYAANELWQPTGAPIVAPAEFSVATTGIRKSTGLNTLIPAGRYVRALQMSVSATFRVARGVVRGHPIATTMLGIVDDMYVASTYAAFGSSPPAWDTSPAGASPLANTVFCVPLA